MTSRRMTWSMWHVWGRGEEVDMGFWWGNLREGLSVDGWIVLKWIFKKYDGDGMGRGLY